MKYKNMIDTRELINQIFAQYSIENDTNIRENMKKKINEICKKTPAVKNNVTTDLYNKSKIILPKHKRASHFYTKQEQELIMNHPDLIKYIKKTISEISAEVKEKLEEEEKYIKAAEKTNKYNDKMLNAPTADDIFTPEEYAKILEEEAENEHIDDIDLDFYTREEAHQEKLFLMVEALFLKFFTPIDEEQLWKDMNIEMLDGVPDIHFTPEMMKAISRYQNKDYYKPLDNK